MDSGERGAQDSRVGEEETALAEETEASKLGGGGWRAGALKARGFREREALIQRF